MTTCRGLEPLLRDTWTADGGAWGVLLDERPRVEAAIRGAWHRWGRPRHVELEDLVADTQVRIVRKAGRSGGLARPPDCGDVDPGRWLATVVGNHAKDAMRGDAARRDSRFVDQAGDDERDVPTRALEDAADQSARADVALEQAEDRADLRRRIGALDGPATYRLALVLFDVPDLLERWLVDAACAHRHGAASGVLRSAEATWEELLRWAERHAHNTQGDASRVHLSWILRSDDDTDPATWRAANPDDVATARDTLRKWHERGRNALKAAR